MMRLWRPVLLLQLAILALSSNSLGQDLNPRVTLFAGGSFHGGDRTFVVGGDPFQSEFLEGHKLGLRGTVDRTEHFSIEAAYSLGRNDLRILELEDLPPQDRTFDVTLHQVTGNLLFYLTPRERVLRPFATVGIGVTHFSPTDEAKVLAITDRFIKDPSSIEASTKLSLNFGGGVEGSLHRWIGVRVDIRDHVSKIPRFGLPETSSGPGGLFFPVNGSVHNIEISAGIVVFLR